MIHTLIFGASVHGAATQWGTLKRILINDGIANEITVDPGLIGIERIVPISAIPEATADGAVLDISDADWKAFAAYRMHGMFGTSNEDEPNLQMMEATEKVGAGITSAIDTRDQVESVVGAALVLTANTVVATGGTERRLKGLIIDTGRPHELVLDDDQTVGVEAVDAWASDRIVVRAPTV